jgi:hypothetical protein
MAKKIYQIQIELLGFKPKIWRKILVPSNLKLHDFHLIIQSTMGWTNSHLHQFLKNETSYILIMSLDDIIEGMNTVDYRKMKISDLLYKENDKLIYEYDFGDGWEHDIILKKILPVEPNIKYPVCLDGKMNCPPEDCGGIFGYADMLKILKQPKHKEYDSYIEWLGEEFDPTFFDINEINELLREPDYGCLEIF